MQCASVCQVVGCGDDLATPGKFWGKSLALRREEKQWSKILFVEEEGRNKSSGQKDNWSFAVLFVVVLSALGLS